jgi:hypothetical protein
VLKELTFLSRRRLDACRVAQERMSAFSCARLQDLVVLGRVACPMHVDPIRSRIGLELVEILVEMGERVLLDRRSERPELLPCISRSRFCRRSQSRSSCIFSCSGAAMKRAAASAWSTGRLPWIGIVLGQQLGMQHGAVDAGILA